MAMVYNSQGEYCDHHTASTVFLILLPLIFFPFTVQYYHMGCRLKQPMRDGIKMVEYIAFVDYKGICLSRRTFLLLLHLR